MLKKRVFSAAATLVGCIIGAGILGLPSVVAKAGFLTGLANIFAIGILFLFINLYLGEVVLRTKGRHYLAHYAEKYLGHTGKRAMFISLVVGIYGALVAYTIGEGAAIQLIFGISDFWGSIIAFAVLSFLVYYGLNAVERAESVVVPVGIGIVLLVSATAFFHVNLENLSEFSFGKLLVPYGVVFFAFMGTSVIPSVKDELGKDVKYFKMVLLAASIVPIIVYSLFVLSLVGVLGVNVNEIASLSFGQILGERFAFVGGLLAMFTMTTSFLGLGIALKLVFQEDYGLGKKSSWFLACAVPFAIFLLLRISNLASFEAVLNITGVITGVITAVLIILMAVAAKVKGNRKPEYSIFINSWIATILILFIILGGILSLVG